jgi:predicted aspartyl protease
MGLFKVRVSIRNAADPQRQREVELLVDTGFLFTWLSASLLDELGIRPAEVRQFQTMTGAMLERRIGYAFLSYDGRTGAANVVFGEPGDMQVLGVTALESLSVTADPVKQTLVPTISLAV